MSIKGIFPIDKWDFGSGSILKGLPGSILDLLERHKTEDKYKKGETVFREGAFPVGIYHITNGKVKKYKVDKFGKQQIIYVANSGELVGYHAVLADSQYPDSAATLEDSIVTFIPREDFLAAIEESNVLSRRLLKTLSHEFAVLANSLTIAHKSVRERLALQLIILREKYKVNFETGMNVVINMGRDDLANLVGTARENVVRMLSEFREEGTVETKGSKITVLDVKKLIEIANFK